MTHLSRRSALVGLILPLSLVLAGCNAGGGGTTTPTGSAPSGGATADQALIVGLVAEPASLDFTKSDGAAGPQALLTNVYEGLVKVDQAGKIVPSLAASWELSADRLTYTFKLRENAKFTNDAPFTADDAVFSINRTQTDWTTSLAKAMAVVKEAKAVNPTTLQVTLSRPSNDWLYRMTTRVGAMFSKTGVADLATKPVGTGPFIFDSWKKGDAIVLKRNPAYWGEKPYFSTITLKYIKDTSALNNALLTNAIDVVSVVAPDQLPRFQGKDAYQVIDGTTNGEVVLSFNNASGPFTDKKVRQAARAAIDHKALVDKCWGGRGQLIGSMVPPTDPWYEDLTGIAPYDVAKAKALLAEAGKTSVPIRLRIPTLPYAPPCGQVVKSQLEQAGFVVTLDQLEFPAAWVTEVFKGGNYDASIVAHVEPRDLPAVFGNPDYYIHYKNPALTAALAAADAGSEADQVAKMKEAARIISEDAASDWLFLLPNLMAAKKDVKGLPTNAVSESFDLTALSRG